MPSNGGAKLNWGPVHNNSNLTCAIDIRVGGTDPMRSDLLEVVFLPMNHSYKIHGEFKLFQVKIKPSWKVDRKIAKLNAENIQEYERSPFDAIESYSMFSRWADTLQFKEHKKIIPLVWDWSFVKPFLVEWMGHASFEHHMSECHREMMSIVNFVNDRSDYWGEEVPVKQVTMKPALSRLGIELIDTNSIAANCLALIELNRSLLHGFIPGFGTKGQGESHKNRQCTVEKTTQEPES